MPEQFTKRDQSEPLALEFVVTYTCTMYGLLKLFACKTFLGNDKNIMPYSISNIYNNYILKMVHAMIFANVRIEEGTFLMVSMDTLHVKIKSHGVFHYQ